MKNNLLLTGYAILLLLLFSPDVMAQNGINNPISQFRKVATFDGIEVSSVFKIIFTQGEPQSVKIEADINLIEHIFTTVKKGILVLDTKGILNNPGTMCVYITAKDLKSLYMSGVSKFNATNKIITPELNINLAGGSTVTLTTDASIVKCFFSGVSKLDLIGTGDQLTADISGVTKLLAPKFKVNDAIINTSGASSASVNASKTVSLNASGTSKIKYVPYESLKFTKKKLAEIGSISVKGDKIVSNSTVEENTDASREVNTNGK